jgi:hypothetical protein
MKQLPKISCEDVNNLRGNLIFNSGDDWSSEMDDDLIEIQEKYFIGEGDDMLIDIQTNLTTPELRYKMYIDLLNFQRKYKILI